MKARPASLPRDHTPEELAAYVAAIPFGKNLKPSGFWGAACVRRVLYGDADPVVAEALGTQLRPVQVIDPDTDTNGFVLFPMPAERVLGVRS